MKPPITTWSYSRLVQFESCKLKAKLMFGDKIPQPEPERQPGELETKLERGIRLHSAAEKFVKGEVELVEELKPFKKELTPLKALFKKGKVKVEDEWAMNAEWKPVAWTSSDSWLRLKCDAVAQITDDHVLVIDYKTGRKWGNEIKHGEQLMLYAIVVMMRQPAVQKVTCEIWYLDNGEVVSREFKREQLDELKAKFDARALNLTTCTDFPANPNMFSCKYCPYGPRGTGHCDKGV